jgi:polar amino acid transport system permease protein
MFRWDVVWHFLFEDPNLFFLQAAWTTLWVSVVAQALGVVIGLFLALMNMSRYAWLRAPAAAYIWFFRGSPLLVQVLLLWDGLPRLTHILLSAIACVLVAFSLNEGAYMSEIIRAAINSVDKGQMEAAKALGMRYPLAMRRIILPQAARVIVPPLGNEFNNMLKTTSIGSVIGLYDLTGSAEIYGSQAFVIFELLIVATVYYLILTTIWTFIQRWIENRLDPDSVQVGKLIEEKSLAHRVMGFGFGGTRR